MVSCCRHGADTIVTSWETAGDSRGEETCTVTSIVDTLEESEGNWVWCSSGSQVVTKSLDGNVSVANDDPVLQRLRSSVVGNIRVGERSSCDICDLELNVEGLIGWQILAWLRVQDDGGDHVGLCGEITHNNTVARSGLDLETIGQGLSGTEVDEVGRVSGRGSFLGINTDGSMETIRLRSGLNVGRVKLENSRVVGLTAIVLSEGWRAQASTHGQGRNDAVVKHVDGGK